MILLVIARILYLFMSAKIGDIAPGFTLQSDSGETFVSGSVRKNLIVYFYPKNDTPGCTNETNVFDKNLDAFSKLDALVVGISKDSVESHAQFKNKHKFSVTLLSDPDNKVASDFDIVVKKSFFGRKISKVKRSTFLINKGKILIKSWHRVKVNGHVEEVLKVAQQLFAS